MVITFELDVDDVLGKEYERLSAENKLLFKHSVYRMLQNATRKLRMQKLKTLLAEMRDESVESEYDPEILLSIIRTEEY